MSPFDQRLSPSAAPPILLIAMPARGDLVAHQLRSAGRMVDAVSAPGEGATPGGRLIVADTHGCDAASLDAVLAMLNRFDAGTPILVSLPFDHVDPVVAGLVHGGAQLLCEPTIDEFAAAVRQRVHEQGDDSEAERLRRIDEEVARIAQVLARLTGDRGGDRSGADELRDRTLRYDAGPGAGSADGGAVDAGVIRRIIRARRLRDQHFDAALFADPAWDMLLDLYAAELERGQVSVSSLCIAAAVPPTTALRWITTMTDRGLFVREADPFDKRRIFIALGPSASAAMRAYFSALVRQGLLLVG